MVICLERGADLHMAQLMPLPLTVSCFSKIQIGFTFLVPAHLGSPRKRAVKRVCVCNHFPFGSFCPVHLPMNLSLFTLCTCRGLTKPHPVNLQTSSILVLEWWEATNVYAVNAVLSCFLTFHTLLFACLCGSHWCLTRRATPRTVRIFKKYHFPIK